jgi:uncharacterized RDD family membrane protein YckC
VSDAVYVYFLAMPLTFVAAAAGIDVGSFGSGTQRGDPDGFMAFAATFSFALLVTVLLYYPLMECSRWQATLAKRRLGLRVVGLDGGRITFPRSLARHVVRFAPLVPLFAHSSFWTVLLASGTLVASIAMAVGRRDKRTLHDLLSGTRVERRV